MILFPYIIGGVKFSKNFAARRPRLHEVNLDVVALKIVRRIFHGNGNREKIYRKIASR